MLTPQTFALAQSAMPSQTGPVAVVFAETAKGLHQTVKDCLAVGFSAVLVIDRTHREVSFSGLEMVRHIKCSFQNPADLALILNTLMPVLAGRWVYYGYCEEFLFFPFRDTRDVRDLTAFLENERRESAFGVAFDLYPQGFEGLTAEGLPEPLYFDAAGYFHKPRFDGPDPVDRQIEVFGGLKWRMREHIPWDDLPAQRQCLFLAHARHKLRPDLRFEEAEMNTSHCPWHKSPTIAIASLRTARGLAHNPGSRAKVSKFLAPQSEEFNWTSKELMACGLMQPGQWF